jgi:hypothetical protein
VGYTNAPFYKPHGDYDYVYVLDQHGWFDRYAHLQSIDDSVQPGKRVKAGEKIGILGKEGSSGGWAHLHFDIKARQPSGKWGIQDAYAFLWEAYVREQNPDVIAVARPHHLAEVGDKVVLDGSRSWSSSGQTIDYEWSFTDGSTGNGARVERLYQKAGAYSEVLKVTDSRGRVGYDMATVQVLSKEQTNNFPPTIHAAYAPTFGIRAGDEVTFKVRTFRTTAGGETWDFGDGSPRVEVQSDGNAKPLGKDGYAVTQHRYVTAGEYIARVERTNERGETAVARLAVEVGELDKHVVVLRRGPLEAVIVDNAAVDDAVLRGHRGGYHGLASLKHTHQQRNIFVPAYAGLNFEHIHDGTTQPREILFEPRFASMELRSIDDHTAELHQPPTPHWGLESWMQYQLLDNGIIEMRFACVPRRVTWKNNYLGLFWANYIDQPESLDIHFLAVPEANWVRGVTPSHGVLATHRAANDDREFVHDADFPLSLVFNFSKCRYAEPWYFGACRGMAFVQLFRGKDEIRLSQSPSGGGCGNPAWDFQHFISNPQVGHRYELVMRALYTPLPDGKSVDESRQEIARKSRTAAFAE